MKTCEQCGKRMRSDKVSNLCNACLSVCACGKAKDWRAKECMACGRSRAATAQWATQPDSILAGIRRAGKIRRIRFEDLSLDTIWQRREDGRHWTWYWVGDKKHTIYRYQWQWIVQHGPIPPGFAIHHLNGDKTDDRDENLACMPRGAHSLVHAPERNWNRWHGHQCPLWTCQTCGKEFRHSDRKRKDGRHPVKYCSVACLQKARRSTTCKSEATIPL